MWEEGKGRHCMERKWGQSFWIITLLLSPLSFSLQISVYDEHESGVKYLTAPMHFDEECNFTEFPNQHLEIAGTETGNKYWWGFYNKWFNLFVKASQMMNNCNHYTNSNYYIVPFARPANCSGKHALLFLFPPK